MLAVDTSRRPRRRRFPTFVLLALLTALVGTGGLLIAARRTMDSVNRVPGVAGELTTGGGSGFVNYLMVGSDSRANGDPNTGVSDVSGSRSDTIMILRHDRSTGTASLLSIPRDLYVDIPGYAKDRINAAFSHSPQTLVQTVKESLGIPVHHYIEVDFAGFKSLVDAIGGVDLCFEVATRDLNTGLNVEPGCHHLDGTGALAYARSRHYEEMTNGQWHEDPTADLGRTKRQQAFVNTAITTALEALKRNPMKAGELMSAIGKSLSIDGDLDPMVAATSMRSAVQSGVITDVLPVTGKTIKGKAIVELAAGSAPVLAYYRGDGPPPPRG